MPNPSLKTADPPKKDGRRLRADKNRKLVAQALLQLLEEGERQPTAQMISRRSGVSTSTLFRLYEDLEALHATVLHNRIEQLREFFVDVPAHLPLQARVRQFVDLRSRFYERVTTVRRQAVSRRPYSPFIDQALSMNEQWFYAQIQRLFAAETDELEQAADMLLGVDSLTSWESWDRLRTVRKLSVKRAKATVEATVLKLLQ